MKPPSSQGDLFSRSEEPGDPVPSGRPYTVSELVARARALLEEHFAFVRVVGEVCDLTVAASGHAYFSLKDDRAVFPAVMFRQALTRLGASPPEGAEVECLGRITVYEPRGRVQLVVEWMAPRGAGALSLRLLQLRTKLQAEGLFDPERKRPLPRFPKGIAVVTSPQGAAVYDILKVLSGRFPSVPVLIAPVRVQGQEAPQEIATAIARMADGRHGDVLILARGGGSTEDLSAFNDEVVVRAVAAAQVPVVSAVGHEVDVLLCDLAADVRAPTPTAAAEMVVPDCREVRRHLLGLAEQLRRLLQLAVEQARRRLFAMAGRVRDPRLVLAAHRIRLDESRERAIALVGWRLQAAGGGLTEVRLRLARQDPRGRLREGRLALAHLVSALRRSIIGGTARRRMLMEARAGMLSDLSPLSVLARGYAVVQGPRGTVLHSSDQVKPGDDLRVRLHRGRIEGTVSRVEPPENHPEGGGEHGRGR